MTPHQRILATLARQPTDRVPVDVWLTDEVVASLLKHTATPNEFELYRTLGVDKIVWVFPDYGTEGRDPWGVETVEIKAGLATYTEVSKRPLADFEEPEELDDCPCWPEPETFNYEAARKLAERARSYNFATIGPWISLFEIYCRMRGMEEALMDLIAEPEFLTAALDRIEAIQTQMLERYLVEMGDLLDIVFISDDLGTQESQLMRTDLWCQNFQPRLKRWCDLVHAHGKTVLFHTDGAAQPFIPHLIASGIDILNPIQHVCPGMELSALKRDFGDQVIFHGAVENQKVLPFGTVDDVRREVIRDLETLGAGGGYIPASCHNIQAGTPPENVIAMIETVQNWRA